MKRNGILLLLFLLPFLFHGQGAGINTTGASPDPSSLLDVSASPGSGAGVLIPRISQADRDAIVNPADFLLILNTDSRCFEFWSAVSSHWISMGCDCMLPSAPAAEEATPITQTSFDVNWSASPGALYYLLDVATDSGFTNILPGYNGTEAGNSMYWTVNGLTCGSTYYYRLRAISGCGSSVNSNTVSVTTSDCFTCGSVSITDIDGNSYPTAQIGSQCWMAKNLNTTKDAAGNSITRICYEGNTNNCNTYGGLYSWTTMMNGTGSSNASPSGVQGICPNGWHVPSHDEWTTLERAICTSGSCVTDFPYNETTTNNWCGTNEGNKLKATSWGGGTDNYGFNALPGGSQGDGAALGQGALWWTSTENGSYAWFRYVYIGNPNIYRNPTHPYYGYGVRCIMD